jgi:hypothetical protein
MRSAWILIVAVAAARTATADTSRCMIVNATDRFLVFTSNKQADQRVPNHRGGLIAAGVFSATEPGGKTVLVQGECKPGDRVEIVARDKSLEAIPLVLATGKAADATADEVAAYINREFKTTAWKPLDVCWRHPAFAPELLVVGRKANSCDTDEVLARDASGALVTITKRGFAWPEPYVDVQVARGGKDAERAAEAWTWQIAWSWPPLEKPTSDFQSKLAPAFFAPRTSTHGDEVWVEAWRSDNLGCYSHERRVHDRHNWSEEEVESFCVSDGHYIVRRADGTILQDGKPFKASDKR